MRCPYCEAPVDASASTCGSCHLTFPKTCALFGALPRVQREVHDSVGVLTAKQIKDMQRQIMRIRGKYPQLYVQVLFYSSSKAHPMRTQVFWLFNAAAFSGDTHRGIGNHTFLVAIDPSAGEAALMPGYGLEPLLDEDLLGEMLDCAGDFWEDGDWVGGVSSILNMLDECLWPQTEALKGPLVIPGEY